jgi:hypothetical protein
VDPDLDCIRIQEDKNDPEKSKPLINFIFAGCSLLRAKAAPVPWTPFMKAEE